MQRMRGFTLVEVLILLLIIAFLLVMIIPAWQRINQAKQQRAADQNQSAPAKL